MKSRVELIGRIGWYVGLLAVLVLLGEIAHSVSVLVALNFSVLPLGDEYRPMYAAVGIWIVGLVVLLVQIVRTPRAAT